MEVNPHTPRRTDDERGQVLVLLVVLLVVLLGMAALVIDVGHAYYVKRTLQSTVDAAALAGAQALPNSSNAVALANDYGAGKGSKNEHKDIPGVSTTVTAKCLTIAPCNPVNALTVQSTVQVQTEFASVFGFGTFTVKAKATACSPCASRPLDIMLVLDRTGSMCMDHWGNVDSSCTDLNNARDGLLTFLKFMDQSIDKVGFAVFPPSASTSTRCNTPSQSSNFFNYDSTSSKYVVVPLSQDFGGTGSLNESSNLVSTIRCIKGNGSTAYATAIEKAQAELDTNGRAGIQDVIVFFSDGAANYGPSYYSSTSPYRKQPCHQGVNSAATVKAKGTIIYSIGYDLDAQSGGANVCMQSYPSTNNESPSITAYSALQQIASKPATFYNKASAGDLSAIYTSIAGDLAGVRLLE